MGIEVTGRIHSIFDTQQVSERFSKREFVLELADGKYPQHVLFQLTGDRCVQLDAFEPGQTVRVDFALRGREWKSPKGETKYFNSLDVWTVEAADSPRARGGARRGKADAPGFDSVTRTDDDVRPRDMGITDDDLPF